MTNQVDNQQASPTPVPQFFIAGVKFHQMGTIIMDMVVGDTLAMVPEPTNKYDPNAVQLVYARHDKEVMCGFVPMKFSATITALIEVGVKLECKIVELNKTEQPWKQCLVEIKEVIDD